MQESQNLTYNYVVCYVHIYLIGSALYTILIMPTKSLQRKYGLLLLQYVVFKLEDQGTSQKFFRR